MTFELLLIVVAFTTLASGWFMIPDEILHNEHFVINSTNAIEMLKQEVEPGDVERFLQIDEEIWTNFLKSQNGFVYKLDLLPHNETIANTTVYQFIIWESYQLWKNISVKLLNQTQQQFVNAMGYTPNLTSIPDGNGFIPLTSYSTFAYH